MSNISRNESTRRVFIAVDISDKAKTKVLAYVDELKLRFPNVRVGWERLEKLHLTVKFVGDADESQVEKIKSIAGQVAAQNRHFSLGLQVTGVFPTAKRARILWLGVRDKTESLLKIKSLIEPVCEEIGIARDRKVPKPHLTIARIKASDPLAVPLIDAHLKANFEPVEFNVREIVIYESKLYPTGSVYSVISKHALI